MTFLERIQKYDRYLKEDSPLGNTQIPEQPPTPVPQKPKTETFSPESEVMLVRLLKKALVIDIKPEDAQTIQKMGDVNETNCREVLNDLITLIKMYGDVDIRTD